MKTTKTVYAHKEHTNEYGVRIADTVYCETTTLPSGSVYKTRYTWVKETGDTKASWYETKQLTRMKKQMEKDCF